MTLPGFPGFNRHDRQRGQSRFNISARAFTTCLYDHFSGMHSDPLELIIFNDIFYQESYKNGFTERSKILAGYGSEK